MDALTALHTRNSVNLLNDPGPTGTQLENIFKAGLRACDHKSLTPWQYIVIEGDARNRLGELFVQVKTSLDGRRLNESVAAKLKSKPLRAPTIIVVVAKIQNHEKVPDIEQTMSAAASAQMMMVAAHAQGIGAIWRSGELMFQPEMRTGLGLELRDQIVGLLYLGTPKATKPLPQHKVEDFVTRW